MYNFIVDELINKENIRIFKDTEMCNPQEKRFTCVICKNKTCIDDSTSIHGHRLICLECKWNKFDFPDDSRHFQKEGYYDR